MRSRSSCLVSLLALLALGLACNSQPAEGTASTPSATAAVRASATLVTPTLGGSVVRAGDWQVELAVLENGSVLGQVYDASGAVTATADLPKVSVELRTHGGGRPRAELSWQPAEGCLSGRAQLSAGLVAEPIVVSLDRNGELSTVALEGYAILPLPRFGGAVLAVGPHAVELVAQGDAVLAHVLEASGQARGGAELSLQLELVGAPALALAWDAQRQHHHAALQGGLDISARPLRLTLGVEGASYTGAVASLGAVARAQAAARGQLTAAAKVQADATADVKAAAAAGTALAAGKAATGKLSASSKLSTSKTATAKVSAKAPSVKVSKSVSASTSTKKPTAKASAGVKAGASFSFGK